MKTILLSRVEGFTYQDYIRKSAKESDYSTLIKEPCKIIDKDTGVLIAVYFVMPKTPTKFLQSLMSIKYQKNIRIRGLNTNSRIFGYKPAEKIRNYFCTSTQLAIESPMEHEIICSFAKYLTKIYKKHCGMVYENHEKIAKEKILSEWVINGTPFSSGIVNKNNQLNYHHDSGNFKGLYSNMVAFKSNLKGGYLAIPEYDIGLEISNNSILLFDGQKILHGVTPMRLMSEKGYRYTIVYYTLQQMWKCETVTKELAKIKDVRIGIERKRLLRLQGKIPNEI